MSQNTDRCTLVHSAIDLMIRTMRAHHRNIDRLVSESGLHRGQRMLLQYLSSTDSVASQKELADKFDVSPACIARSLKALACDGYITRSGSEDDLRRNSVQITEKGLQSLANTRRLFDEFDARIFAGISDDEIGQLTALLTRIQENIRQCEEEDRTSQQKGCAFP